MADPSFNPLGGDLPTASRFLFTLDSVQIGVFSEVSGLELTVAVEEFSEGGQNGYVHKVPGRMSWPNITFKRGVTQGNALFEWLQKSSGEGFAAAGNKVGRGTGAITAVDHAGKPMRSWNLIDVFPIRWKGPEFSVGSNDPLQEELEVAHHGFTVKTHP
jgi:phage tail-like protein